MASLESEIDLTLISSERCVILCNENTASIFLISSDESKDDNWLRKRTSSIAFSDSSTALSDEDVKIKL